MCLFFFDFYDAFFDRLTDLIAPKLTTFRSQHLIKACFRNLSDVCCQAVIK